MDLPHKVVALNINEVIHMKSHWNVNYVKKRFKESGHLISHKWSLTEAKAFKCDLCEKGCNQSGSLTSHEWIQTEAKPLKCDLCETRFTRPINCTLMNSYKCKVIEVWCVWKNTVI